MRGDRVGAGTQWTVSGSHIVQAHSGSHTVQEHTGSHMVQEHRGSHMSRSSPGICPGCGGRPAESVG